MFGRQTAARFEQTPPPSDLGPGSYELPSSLDACGRTPCMHPSWDGPDRWQDSSSMELSGGSPGPGDYDPKGDERNSDPRGMPSTPLSARRQVLAGPPSTPLSSRRSIRGESVSFPLAGKENLAEENRTPALQRRPSLQKLRTPASPASALKRNGAQEPVVAAAVRDAEPKRPLTHRSDPRLAAQLDQTKEDLKQRAREIRELQQQASARDRKLEEAQRRAEDLQEDKRAAHKRASDAEGERAAMRRQLYEKEQELLALQFKGERLRLAVDERSKGSQRREEERAAVSEEKKLRSCVEGLQERLATAEKDLKASEQNLRQQQRRNAELEEGMKDHIAVVEESLRREEARRRELEERTAHGDALKEQGATELAKERGRADELQALVNLLEAEVKSTRSRLAAQKERGEDQGRLEDELSALRARAAAQGEELRTSEETRQELETRATRAEVRAREAAAEVAKAQVATEARAREAVAEAARATAEAARATAEAARAAELQEAQRCSSEAHSGELRRQAEEAEAACSALSLDLADERARSEALERRLEQLEEQARSAGARPCAPPRDEVAHHGELEARLQRAEADAEAAAVEVQRWREWADEQSLREITSEGNRIEELRNVREDVTRQVEEARREVVKDNEDLRRRIRELDLGLPQGSVVLQERLDEAEGRAQDQAEEAAQLKAENAELEALFAQAREDEARSAEERRTLEARVARAEADQALVADELSDERERFEAELRALKAEAAKIEPAEQRERQLEEACQATKEALAKECEARVEGESALREARKALSGARAAGAALRWQALVEASAHRQLALDVAARWEQARRWRGLSHGCERDGEMLTRQEAELERLDAEAEDLRAQNAQLLESLRGGQQELDVSSSELKRLREREDAYESSMQKLSERSAELGGHANHKQKIKHLESLKQDNISLRDELKRFKQRAAQLEEQLRKTQFFDPNTSVTAPAEARCRTAAKKAAAEVAPPRSAELGGSAEDSAENMRRERAENARHARAHQRASERAMNEYQHLISLVEQATGDDAARDPRLMLARLRELCAPGCRGGRTEAGGEEPPKTPRRRAQAP